MNPYNDLKSEEPLPGFVIKNYSTHSYGSLAVARKPELWATKGGLRLGNEFYALALPRKAKEDF